MIEFFEIKNARLKDRETYLLTSYHKAKTRFALRVIILFDQELAAIYHNVQEPQIGMIRLQWWQERLQEIYDNSAELEQKQSAIEKHNPSHPPILAALSQIITQYPFSKSWFDMMIAARKLEFSHFPFPNQEVFDDYLTQLSGGYFSLWADILRANNNHILKQNQEFYQEFQKLAKIYRLSRIVRSLIQQAQSSKSSAGANARNCLFLPQNLLQIQGLDAARPIEALREQVKMREILQSLISATLLESDKSAQFLKMHYETQKFPELFRFVYFAKSCLQHFATHHYDYISPRATHPPLFLGVKMLLKRQFL